MKTYNNLYQNIYDFDNLLLAYQKARKGKTKKFYVIKFEKNLEKNLLDLQFELKNKFYKPLPLETFILRDPKTRKISKSDFRDRVVHHAIVNILEPIFEKTFIHDSCANRKGKGTLHALKRFEVFRRKVTNNFTSEAFCLKADIKHYFEEVDHEILLEIIKRKITEENVLWLIKKILNVSYENAKRSLLSGSHEPSNKANFEMEREITKGMPLGNLTSQFFANIYLNELDYFVKHKLKAKYYIRYVDDFVILHKPKQQLEEWKEIILKFLREKLKLELHKDKSKIVSLSCGIDFVGFRNFYHFKLLRKRNIRKMINKVQKYKSKEISKEKILEIFQGWQAHAKWSDSFKLRKLAVRNIYRTNN